MARSAIFKGIADETSRTAGSGAVSPIAMEMKMAEIAIF
jgi:hypothetical protein